MDDERFHLKGIKTGWRWDEKIRSMVYRSIWREEDTMEGLTRTQLTA